MNDDPGRSNQRDVWLLLTRHIVDTRRSDEYISLSVRSDDFVQEDVLSIKVCGILGAEHYH